MQSAPIYTLDSNSTSQASNSNGIGGNKQIPRFTCLAFTVIIVCCLSFVFHIAPYTFQYLLKTTFSFEQITKIPIGLKFLSKNYPNSVKPKRNEIKKLQNRKSLLQRAAWANVDANEL